MVYLICGTQNIRIKQAINRICKQVLPEKDEMNYVRFDATVATLGQILDEAYYLPLGYEHKIVIADNTSLFVRKKKKKTSSKKEDKPSKNEKEDELSDDEKEVINYINSQDENVDLIFTVSTLEIDKTSPVYLAIESKGKLVVINEPTEATWSKDVQEFVRNYFKVKIDYDALKELTDRTKYDVALLKNSVEKLALYTDHIKYDDVCLMVVRPLEENSFKLFNHLINGKKDEALQLYRDLKEGNAEPVTLISMLANKFRQMNEVTYLAKLGYNEDEIAGELGIKVQVAGILKKQIYLVSESCLHTALEDLFQLDLKIKKGLLDPYYAFELFLLNFERK